MKASIRGAVSGGGPWLCMGLLALLAGCESGEPMKIETRWTPGVAYTDLGTTFDFVPLPPQRNGRSAMPPELDAGLRRTVEDGFVARGYRQQPNPDFLVGYLVSKSKQGDPRSTGGVQEYEEGSLVIDVLKPGTDRLLWRGWARARITESANPDERQKRIRSAVDRLLKGFPAAKR